MTEKSQDIIERQTSSTEVVRVAAESATIALDGLQPVRQIEACYPNVEDPVLLQELAKVTLRSDQVTRTVLLATSGFDKYGKPNGITVIEPIVGSSIDDRIDVARSSTYYGTGMTNKIAIEKGSVYLTSQKSKYDRSVRLDWYPYRNTDTPQTIVEIEVSSDSSLTQMKSTQADVVDDRYSKLGRLAKKTIVGLGILATVKGGGFIDQAIDPFQDAGELVRERLVTDPALPDTINGIQFSDLPVEEQVSRREGARLHDMATVGSIAQTMSDLDNHNTEAIQARADIFYHEHADEIMTERRKAELLTELEQAGSSDESAAVLDKFMQFYGKSAELARDDLGATEGMFRLYDDQSISNDDLKSTIRNVVNAYSYVPKSVLEDAGFNIIRLVGADLMSSVGAAYVGSGHMDERGTMYLPVNSSLQQVIMAPYDIVTRPLGLDGKPSKIIWHETGHGAASGYEDHNKTYGNLPGFLGRTLLGIPNYASAYAAFGGVGENDAESHARVMDRTEGLVHPDDARQFWSGSSQQLLKVMGRYELKYPGITDYLVSLNPSLMERM